MKQIFFGILLFFSGSTYAVIVDSMFIIGVGYKLIHIANDHHFGYLYAENYQHQKILIYKSKAPYLPNSTFTSEQIEGTDILDIGFGCGKEICTRYFNRRTNAISGIYSDVLDYNGKQDVIAYYLKNRNLLVINRVFKTCKEPLTDLLKIQQGSDFGTKTKFLPSGGLQVDYTDPSGKDVIKTIHPNYSKLWFCRK